MFLGNKDKKDPEKKEAPKTNKKYICDFWNRHPLNLKCGCHHKFWSYWMVFKQRLREMWFDIFYNKDITSDMQREYLIKYNNYE